MKNVLFVCVENSCLSQIAEGFAKHFGNGMFESYSAGSRPSGKINPTAIEVMKEVGIDISSQRSKGFNDLDVKQFDAVITLGCGDICPFVPATEHMAWEIEDPKGMNIEGFRKIRDKVRDKVQALSKSISDNEI